MSGFTFEDFRLGLDHRKSEQVSDARSLQECTNAYVTSGYAISKRPGMDNLHGATALDTNFHGLFVFDQKLVTVTHAAGFVAPPVLAGIGIGDPISSTLQVVICSNPDSVGDTVQHVWEFLVFNRKPYIVVEFASGTIRHFFGTLAQHIVGTSTVITDTNCPNTKSAVVTASKIFAIGTNAAGDAYIKYSATEDPTDWSSPDDASGALGLPAGLESSDEDEIIALGVFRGKLISFMTNNIQLWKTDPDPSLIELESVIENGYVTFTDTIAPLGADLVFLNKAGFYSAGQMLYTDRMIAADIGAPVSNIVLPKMTADAATYEPIAVHFSGNDQYICVIKDEMFVLTHSASSQLTAWSKYTMSPGSVISGMCSYRTLLYVKMSNASGDFIFGFDPDKYNDDIAGVATTNFDVQITSGFQTLGGSGRWKKIYGMDAMFVGTADIQHRWDARTPAAKTTAVSLNGDTRPTPMVPVELMTTEISFDITQSANSALLINGLTYYYQPLGEF
jgi:hypothetical protein